MMERSRNQSWVKASVQLWLPDSHPHSSIGHCGKVTSHCCCCRPASANSGGPAGSATATFGAAKPGDRSSISYYCCAYSFRIGQSPYGHLPSLPPFHPRPDCYGQWHSGYHYERTGPTPFAGAARHDGWVGGWLPRGGTILRWYSRRPVDGRGNCRSVYLAGQFEKLNSV